MKIGSFNADTVDDCLNILEDAFRSDMWRQLPNEDRLMIVGRLEHILETAQLKSMGE